MVASRISAACIALLLLASALPAPGAADPSPVLLPDAASPAPDAQVQTTAAACTLEPGPIETSASYAWTLPDAFSNVAWLVPRASCTACAPGLGLEIKTVSFRVRWFGACTATAEVSIVGATGSTGCRVPDPNHVLYGPASFQIVGTGSLGIVHTLTLPAAWCVGTEAFVMIHFVGLDACYPSGSSPGLTRTSTTCVSCSEYVSTIVSSPTLADWCTLATNSLWMQVEADCCGTVGVGPGPGAPRAAAIVILDGPSRQVRMRISLAAREPVELSVYDIAGRRVRALVRSELEAGDHFVGWDGASDAGARLPAGVYKVRLRAGSARAVGTAVLLD